MDANNALSRSKPVSITMLGTGDAFASGGRAQAGYFVQADGVGILMEAGPELLGSMKRAGLRPGDIDVVLISHLHGDHYGGIPFLMLEYLWETKLDHKVVIAGPRNLEPRCWRLMNTLFPGFDLARIKRKIKFVELAPGKSAKIGKLKITSIRSPHTAPDISLSFRIEADGRTIAFSGDTGWNDELVRLVDGADLFICECTYYESRHLKFHLNYPELAANRGRFNVGRMVLTHIGREVLRHKAEVEVEMGFDGMRIEI
jgi:ribonuclease BN (tRNA processing enzyme)